MRSRWLLYLLLVSVTYKTTAQTAVGSWVDEGPILFPVNVSGQVDGMGRVCQIKFHPTNPQKMYAVSASGGLYISTNNGINWAVTGTDQLPTTQCSAVCIDYTNDSIIYLSTGDPDYYSNDYGIYKSTNGGLSFSPSNTNIGTAMAVEILMDPNNHNSLVAATRNGIWKTTNAGANWTHEVTSGKFKDMKQKPGSATVLYAVTDTLFYRSLDFGNTWTNITSGFTVPVGNGGLRIAVSAADTNVVYVGTTNGYGEILKSTNGGQTFSLIYSSTTQCIVCYDSTVTSGSQGDYNFTMNANPLNANELLLGSHCVWRSMDGGLTWSMRTQWYDQIHTDMHHMLWNPYNNNQVFNANDGGVWMTTDTLATNWSPWSTGLAATEIYHAAQSPIERQMISIGTQDNGELYFDNIWKCNRGGDWGAKNAFDYIEPEVWYLNAGNRRVLQPLGGDQSFNSPFIPTNNAAIDFVPSMTNVAFIGNDTLSRSTNINTASPSWATLDVLTGTIESIASCRADSNELYAVTNGSNLYRSDNALASVPTFTLLTTPVSTSVAASLATDKHNANVVYLSCGQKLYRSANKGVSWTNISGNLPAVNIIKVIADDYSTQERLFVALGNYVYYKDSTTTTWTLIQGLPSIPEITDLMIYNDGTAASVLRLSTYGRGTWECNIHDDLPPVAALSANKQYICPADTIRFNKTIYGNYSSFVWNFPGGTPATSTADSPVVIYPTTGTYNVTLTVLGAAGNDTVINANYIVVSNGTVTSLQEGFEGAIFPPSAAWLNLSQSGNYWQSTDQVGGYGTSTHSMFFDNYDNDAGGAHDRIITPTIDLTNADTAYVTFDVAYAYYSGYNDSLQVEVSTDCGKTFSTVYEKDENTLATAPNTTSSFVPTASQWRTDTITLNAYVGNPLELAFDNIGHYGENLYVDNINIKSIHHSGVGINNLNGAANVQVYPNPSTGLVAVKATNVYGNTAVIDCYNVIGQLVNIKSAGISNGSISTELDLSALPKGMYELKIETDAGSRFIRKIILQ